MKRFIDKGRVVAKKRLVSVIQSIFGSIKPAYRPQTCLNFNGTINDASGKSWTNSGMTLKVIPTDEGFSERKILTHLRFNGTNGSTTFTDEAELTSWTNNSGVVISNANSKFGGTSVYFSGNSQLGTSTNADYYLNTTDFTVEFFLNVAVAGGSAQGYVRRVFSIGGTTPGWNSTNGIHILIQHVAGTNNAINFQMLNAAKNGALGVTSANNTANLNTWVHVAMTVQGSTAYCFVDGVLAGTITNFSFPSNTTPYCMFGNLAGESPASGYSLNGYIDEVRIIKGYAKYTSDFLPPTEALPSPVNIAKTGGQSAYFNGSSYYVAGDYAIGSTDFTMEAWVYPTTENVLRIIFDFRPNGDAGNGAYPVLSININNKLTYTASSVNLVSSSTIPINQWTHIAYSRVKGIGYLFISGNLEATQIDQITYVNFQTYIGKTPNTPSYNFTGYMDEVSIHKWVGKYKENFIPQNSNLFHSVGFNTPKGNFQLASLLHFYGEDTSNGFSDVTMKTWTAVNAIISTSRSKNGYPSGYFNGTNAYISTPSHTDFALGTGDFTIESHVFIDGDSPLLSNERTATIMQNASNGLGGMALYIYGNTTTTGTGIGFWIWNVSGSNWDKIQNTNFAFNKLQWYHIAVSRVSGITTIYVDGVAVASGSQTRSIVSSSSLTVGANVVSGYQWYLKGFLSDFRIVKGTALYTSAFTPPTEVLPDLGNNIFGDVTNKSWTTTGTLTIDTNQALFNKASMYFNGSSQTQITATSDLDLNAHDFTIELWIRPEVLPGAGQYTRYLMFGTNGSNSSLQFYLDSNGYVMMIRAQGGITGIGSANGAVPINKWTLVTLCLKGTTAYLFIDGTLVSTAVGFTKPAAGNMSLCLGRDPGGNGTYFKGWMQDLRVIKGTALYTESFPKPTKSCWD